MFKIETTNSKILDNKTINTNILSFNNTNTSSNIVIKREVNNNSNSLENLISVNKKLKEDILLNESIIFNNKEIIKKNEKEIWKLCDHKWERDNECSFDDHIKYYCTKCKLWKCSYLYT